MRLGALLLSTVLAAQSPRALPWEGLPPAAWQGLFDDPSGPAPPPTAAPRPAARWVLLAEDGTLRVVDGRGVVRLRAGLPGRPRLVWRDGGRPVPPPWSRLPFPDGEPHPLFAGAFWSGADPRAGLEGLLWIQDDSERVLSLVHPATGKVAFLPLPGAPGLQLDFRPEGLVAVEEAGPAPRPRRWILPWIALAPVLARLAPPAQPPRAGTALQPFPRE